MYRCSSCNRFIGFIEGTFICPYSGKKSKVVPQFRIKKKVPKRAKNAED